MALAAASTVLLTSAPASADFGTGTFTGDDVQPCETPETEGEDLTAKEWTTDKLGLNEAHQYNEGRFEDGSRVKIAVIDSGVQSTHEIFGDRVSSGFDIFDPDGNGQCDGYQHGTGVAGIAAGGAESNQFVGVAPQAEILPIRLFLDAEEGAGFDKSEQLASVINDAVSKGADVINISLVTPPTPKLEQAVKDAIAADVVIVAATGNAGIDMDSTEYSGEDAGYYPANYEEVIAVGAHDENGAYYKETNFGAKIDILAPGVNVTMPFPGGGWFTDSGTSFAAPFVSGAAALLKGEFGKTTDVKWISDRLKDTALPPPDDFNRYQGYGVLNVAAALTAPDPSEDGESESPAPPADAEQRSIAGIDVDYDPLSTAKTVAWASIGIAIVVITLVLVLRKIVPDGRKRGWRPGTRDVDRLPVKAGAEDTA